jgi:hypothetical protein
MKSSLRNLRKQVVLKLENLNLKKRQGWSKIK